MRKSLLLVAVLGALASSEAVMAAEAAAPTPTWTFPATATLVSDYIWHGQSQTWGNPAAQFGIEADHVSGAYAGFWASNVSSNWLPNANLEMDFSAGFRNTFATDFKYDVGTTYIYYPDGDFKKSPAASYYPYGKSKLNTVEIYGSLGWKWFTVKGGVNPTKFYGWDTSNSGADAANFGTGDTNAGIKTGGSTRWSGYVVASASYDVPAVSGLNISGEVGHQMITDSTGLDWTWFKIGATKTFADTWAVNAFYTGTSGSNAYEGFASFNTANPDLAIDRSNVDKSKLVVGISKSF